MTDRQLLDKAIAHGWVPLGITDDDVLAQPNELLDSDYLTDETIDAYMLLNDFTRQHESED